jgi:hypothetical protein
MKILIRFLLFLSPTAAGVNRAAESETESAQKPAVRRKWLGNAGWEIQIGKTIIPHPGDDPGDVK